MARLSGGSTIALWRSPDPYRGVVVVLLALALLGMLAAVAGGIVLSDPLLFDAAVSLEISTGILIGVVVAQSERAQPLKEAEQALPLTPGREAGSVETALTGVAEAAAPPWIVRQLRGLGRWRVWTSAAGVLGITVVFPLGLSAAAPTPVRAAIGTLCCVGTAWLAFTVARYLADVEPARLPEAPTLCRGARVLAWILIAAAASIPLAYAGQQTPIRILHLLLVLVNVAVCVGLLTPARSEDSGAESCLPDMGVLSLLGSRTNIAASVLDAAQRQLGIDLRSTWALTVVRRSAEPLLIGLLLLAWLSTSLTVVRVDEQGLVERLGMPSAREPLSPGLHLHWPWPVDRVFRIPVQHVQALTVGHQGEEEGGPEDVLWARQHAAHEYTLLLGNGRDLIAVDAAVQFRITDANAWFYRCQNPTDALRAVAYRAVMRSTVNLTLDEALSENLVALTARMRTMVQRDADALGLGVEVVTFTIGGMHPPVKVAPAYQAVVSAELDKVTAATNAEAFRNQTVPAAEADVVTKLNAARAEAVESTGRALGQAWSFRALEEQYQAAPREYRFRRRLETLESTLAGRKFTVVDSRIQRDGGELWLIP